MKRKGSKCKNCEYRRVRSVAGRPGKRPYYGECNKVKKHHISAFLQLICNQPLFHSPPALILAKTRCLQCPSLGIPPSSCVLLGSWELYGPE